MKHIVFYSGGLCSYATADRVIKKYGKENVILFFTDTKTEDEDLYRFLNETVKDFDCEFINIADGRNVWELMEEEKFLGNSRVANCSKKLKQKISKKYIKKHFKPEDCILYLGIDWTEIHRIESPKRNWKPYNVEFPMTEEPYFSKKDMIELVESKGIKIPRLYQMGFSHNNCGGFCVRAGQGHFINLLEKMPDRYKYHEDKEQELIKKIGKDVSILRKTIDKKRINITLKNLRKEYENDSNQIDMLDIGGCGCFSEDFNKKGGL